VQETRGWDDAKLITTSQRSKEDAQDYRYMPDADIPPIVLTAEEIAKVQSTVPALPPFYREAWKVLNFDDTVVNALLASQSSAELVQRLLDRAEESAARRTGLWFLMALVEEADADVREEQNGQPISDDLFIELTHMVDGDELSSTAAKEVFFEMLKTSQSPRAIAETKNLLQVSDEGAIAAIVDEVLADPASAKAVEDIRNGNDKVIGFLVGQIMKRSQGKANPALAQKLIRERL